MPEISQQQSALRCSAFARVQAGVVRHHQIFVCKGAGTPMRKSTLVTLMAAGLALLPIGSAFSAAPNPTPTRESKLLVDFESDTTVTSDPTGAGETRATINTDAQFVAEGTKSLCLDLSGVGGWHDHYFTIDFAQPIDIQGFTILAMDVYIPLQSLNNGVPEGGWFQLDPRTTTQNRDDATM